MAYPPSTPQGFISPRMKRPFPGAPGGFGGPSRLPKEPKSWGIELPSYRPTFDPSTGQFGSLMSAYNAPKPSFGQFSGVRPPYGGGRPSNASYNYDNQTNFSPCGPLFDYGETNYDNVESEYTTGNWMAHDGGGYGGVSNNNTSLDFTEDYSVVGSLSIDKQGGSQYNQNISQKPLGNRSHNPNWNRGRGGGRGNRRGNNRQGGGYGKQGCFEKMRGQGGNRGNNQSARRGNASRTGLPPNSFSSVRGKGRGKKDSAVPPVHTLSKVKLTAEELQNMSTAEKLRRLSLFLKSEDSVKENPQQTLNCAISSCKLNIKAVFQMDILLKLSGGALYTGTLCLDGVFMARGIKPTKKELQIAVYQKAINELMTKTVAEIYNLKDPGLDHLREQVIKQLEIDKEASCVSPQDLYTSTAVSDMIGTNIATMVQKLCLAIKSGEGGSGNPIQIIELASTRSHLLIRQQFTSEMTRLVNNEQFHKGKLAIGSLVIARGCGIGKKQAKSETYKNAYDRLTTKPLEELLVSVPELPDPDQVAVQDVKFLPQEKRMVKFIADLRTMSQRSSYINTIDIVALRNCISPMIIYQRNEMETNGVLCELYLDNILISSSSGTVKKDCMMMAYKKAFEMLMENEADVILTQHKRITEEEIKNSKFLDVIAKGTGKTLESNMAGLARFGFFPDIIEKQKLEDLVLVEHENWGERRLLNAHGILQYSCNQNGMVLQWETDTEQSLYRCVVSIQKEVVGQGIGKSKNQARHLACVDALCKLYETHDAVRFCPRSDDSDKWIPWENIVAEAAAVKAEKEKQKGEKMEDSTALAEDVKEEQKDDTVANDAEMKQEGEVASGTEGEKIIKSKREHAKKAYDMEMDCAAVILPKMDELANSDENRELIIGPGIPNFVVKELRLHGRQYSLRADIQYHNGKQYLIISRKLPWKQLVSHLRATGGQYGRFLLVNKAELPTQADGHEMIVQRSVSVGKEIKEALEKYGMYELAAEVEEKLASQKKKAAEGDESHVVNVEIELPEDKPTDTTEATINAENVAMQIKEEKD